MALTSIKEIDGKLFVPLPVEAMEHSLAEGSEVDVTYAAGRVLISDPVHQIPVYNLDELLDEWEQMPDEMKKYCEWVDAPLVGREII